MTNYYITGIVILEKWVCVLCVFKLISHIMVACNLAHLVAHLITYMYIYIYIYI